MSPEVYLQFAAGFLSCFLKIAVAWLLCRLLAGMIVGPRPKFALWMGFSIVSLAYWIYAVISAFSVQSTSSLLPRQHASALPRIAHPVLVPAQYERATAVLGRFAVYAYLCGVLLLVARATWKRLRLRLLLNRAGTPSGELKNLFAEMRHQFAVRQCELLVLPGLSSPATVGWWRPRILLPETYGELGDRSVMADILNHELAHVARRDYLWSTISDIVCQILFFHPAVWQAQKQMRLQREMACDLAVVAAWPEHRADYAHTLTRVARLVLPRKYPIIGIDFAASPSLLSRRVRAILDDPERCSWAQKLVRTVTGGLLVTGYALFCAALAIVIAFAPAKQNAAVTELQTEKLPVQSDSRPRTVREPLAHPNEQNFITESPAYRLGSSPAASYKVVERVASGEDSTAEVSTTSIPKWKQPGRPAGSGGSTVESIIVATVGAVIGADADDRGGKRHETH